MSQAYWFLGCAVLSLCLVLKIVLFCEIWVVFSLSFTLASGFVCFWPSVFCACVVCAVCAASATLSSWDCFCCDCLSCTCCGIAGWLVTVFCVPRRSSFLLISLGVYSAAFSHLGLLSHPILMFFLAWVSSFGVCRGLGLRCCGPVFRIFPSFGRELSFPCLVVLSWLLQHCSFLSR